MQKNILDAFLLPKSKLEICDAKATSYCWLDVVTCLKWSDDNWGLKFYIKGEHISYI